MKSVAEIRAEKQAATASPEAAGGEQAKGGAMAQGRQAAAGGAQEGSEERYSFQEDATEEEQDAYARVVLAGSEILFAEETNAKIMQMLKDGADTPEVTIARVAQLLMQQVDDASGGQVPETVILPAVAEYVEQIGELANASGTFAVDEAMLNRAAQEAVMMVGEDYGVEQPDLEEFMASIPEADMQQAVQRQKGYQPQQQAQPAQGA